MKSNKEVRHRPATWEKLTGIKIYDPDGWRDDGQSFYKPITRAEWNRRQMISTCIYSQLAKNKEIITVWKVTVDGRSCYTEHKQDALDTVGDKGVMTKEKISREAFDRLPEFEGF